jgi:hypothetical protein
MYVCLGFLTQADGPRGVRVERTALGPTADEKSFLTEYFEARVRFLESDDFLRQFCD